MQTVARIALSATLILGTPSCFHRSLDSSVGMDISISNPGFSHSIAKTAQTPWTEGNKIETLVNGDAFYPKIPQAIQDAKHSITFETFAYVPGQIATDFTNALVLKAQEGVQIYVISDAIGSAELPASHLKPMRIHDAYQTSRRRRPLHHHRLSQPRRQLVFHQ